MFPNIMKDESYAQLRDIKRPGRSAGRAEENGEEVSHVLRRGNSRTLPQNIAITAEYHSTDAARVSMALTVSRQTA